MREAVASFPTLLFSDMINTYFVARISDASRTLRATAAHKRLITLALHRVRWFWISATRSRHACRSVGTCTLSPPATHGRGHPGRWFTTTKTPACIGFWHRRIAGLSKLGQGCSTRQSSSWRGREATGLFCATLLPNSIRRPSSDSHFTHPKHRPSINDARDDRVMSIAADHDAPKSTSWLVCAPSVELLDGY